MKKQFLAIILATLMILPSIVSCSNSGTNADTEAAPSAQPDAADTSAVESEAVEEETGYLDDLPEVTFNGASFTIYSNNVLTNDWYLTNYTDFTEDSANALESSIYHRNRKIEERFDILISETIDEMSTIRSIISAGDDSMDLCLIGASDALSLAQSGNLYDQLKLDNLDLTKPYWDQNIVRDLVIAGKLYFTSGDALTAHFDVIKPFFFNKGLIEDYNLANPYELVDDMKWTIAAMKEMVTAVSDDLNGDGIMDDNDRWGLLSYTSCLYPTFVFGTGEQFIKVDEEGKPYVAFYSDRFVEACEAIADMTHANGDTIFYDAGRQNTHGLSNNHRVQEVMFPNNQALFWTENLAWSKALREMEMDFGIITAPMLNEEQGQYSNYPSGGGYGSCIPVSVKDLEMTTVVLEALNSMSSNTVRSTYYDVMIKSKLARDEDSSRMLDIIFDTLTYDVGVTYGLGGIKDSVSNMIASNEIDIASFYAKNAKLLSKNFDKVYEKLSSLDH